MKNQLGYLFRKISEMLSRAWIIVALLKLLTRLGYKMAAQSRWRREWFKSGVSGSTQVQDIIDEGPLGGRRNKKARGRGDQRREAVDQRRLRVRHSGVIAKLGKGANIQTDTLLRICQFLDCDIADICEAIPATPKGETD